MIVVHLLSTLGWPSHIGTEKLDELDEGSVSSLTKSVPELELLLTEVTLVAVSLRILYGKRPKEGVPGMQVILWWEVQIS